MNPAARARLEELAALLASAALYYFGAGLDGVAALVWVAPLPVLVIALAPRRGAWRSACVAFAAYVLGGLSLVPYLLRVAPPPAIAAALVVPALAFALAAALQRALAARSKRWWAALAFPAAWTAYEFLLSLVSPDGTALQLTYTQARALPLVQLAAYTGLAGIGFLLTWVPAGIALAWTRRGDRRAAAWTVAPPLVALVLVCTGGIARLTGDRATGSARRASLIVGAIASDANIELFETTTRELALDVVHAYAQRVDELAQRGASFVVLPEKLVGVTPAYEGEALEILRAAARRNRLTLIAGLNRIGAPSSRNSAFVLGPDGSTQLEYDKAFLVSGFESDYERGMAPGVFTAISGSSDPLIAGVAICKDMDFPRWLRRYAERDVRIVFVPAWDFVVDGELHARMAMLRGVEGGFAVVRAARQGWLTISDPYGRALNRAASSDLDTVVLMAQLPLMGAPTFYTRSGDWFGWTSVVLLALFVSRTCTTRARSK